MTEERHTFSDPRSKSFDNSSSSNDPSTPPSCCWEVDIYRNGVPDPIDTIEISDETLPPRTNKKGKVLWRLPSKPDSLPSFGTVERRRIMDLVKERKKNRRKKSGGAVANGVGDGTPTVSTVVNVPGAMEDGRKSAATPERRKKKNRRKKSGGAVATGVGDGTPTVSTVVNVPGAMEDGRKSASTPERMKKKKGDSSGLRPDVSAAVAGEESNGGRMEADLSTGDTNASNDMTKKVSTGDGKVSRARIKKTSASAYLSKRKKKKDTSTFVPSMTEDDVPDVRSHFIRKEEDKLAISKTEENDVSNAFAPPPGLPPGFGQSLSSISLEAAASHSDDMGDGIIPSNSIDNQMSNDSQTMPNNSISLDQPSPNLPLNPPAPPSRHIIIPEQDRPTKSNRNPHPSLAVAAATAFIDLYYPHITHGLTSELALHYTAQAQKSISVGGAHSVVADKSDIILQLSSLACSVFFVRGVVAQDSHDGYGVHILVTGVVQTTALPSSSGVSPFAHSISLIPVVVERRRMMNGGAGSIEDDEMSYAFQIHNDALSLLTVVEMMAPVAVSPWHDSMTGQHQQPQHQQPQHHQPLHQQPRRQPLHEPQHQQEMQQSSHQPQHEQPNQDVPHLNGRRRLSNPPFNGKQPPPGLF